MSNLCKLRHRKKALENSFFKNGIFDFAAIDRIFFLIKSNLQMRIITKIFIKVFQLNLDDKKCLQTA